MQQEGPSYEDKYEEFSTSQFSGGDISEEDEDVEVDGEYAPLYTMADQGESVKKLREDEQENGALRLSSSAAEMLYANRVSLVIHL